jgi:hypothetical protein
VILPEIAQVTPDFALIAGDLGAACTVAQVSTQLKTIVKQLSAIVSNVGPIIIERAVPIIRRSRRGDGEQSANHECA